MHTEKTTSVPASPARKLAREEVWALLNQECRAELESCSLIGSYLFECILRFDSFEDALARRLAECIGGPAYHSDALAGTFRPILTDPAFPLEHVFDDVAAFRSRDPACSRLHQVLLYYKGFHALQLYRISNFLWKIGETGFARFINYRVSANLSVDIHPAAQIDSGIFIDHGTGVVIGETAIVGSGVSIMQDVTLGGTGKDAGRRHPEICSGVQIGAGAKILGNIKIGHFCKIGAGTIVLKGAPGYCTIVGVPGRIVAKCGGANPAGPMGLEILQ